jgi:hypothetical protein
MSEVVESRQSNRAAEDLSDFLLAQKSAYLQALDQGEAQKGSWTISMGNEAGGLHSYDRSLHNYAYVPDGLIYI